MPITYATSNIDGGLDCSSLSIGILKSMPDSPIVKVMVIAGKQAHPIWALDRLALVIYSYVQSAKYHYPRGPLPIQVNVRGSLISNDITSEVPLSARSAADPGQRPRLADQQRYHIQYYGRHHRLAHVGDDPHRCRALDRQDVFQHASDCPVARKDGDDPAGQWRDSLCEALKLMGESLSSISWGAKKPIPLPP